MTLRPEPMKQSLKAQCSSESVEWYTPARYIARVHAVLGGIDLDPASCVHANKTVTAYRIFTKRQDGLKRPWICKSLFLNPPYGRMHGSSGPSRQAVWTKYLLQQLAVNVFQENAILLVNANTSEKWFRPLFDFPICFVDHRIRYLTRHGALDTAKKGSAFVYFGPDRDLFCKHFSIFGPIVETVS